MGHDHSHHHSHSHDHHHHAVGNIKVAFWLNTGFALLELVGGLYTNSVAILSDSLHDFGDSLSLGLSYYFQKKSVKERDASFSYGYKRFSLLGAFINSLVLIVGSVFIIQEIIERLIHPEPSNAKGMLIFALIGVVVNGAAMLRLKKGSTINERVISLHFLEDILGWVAVLIGSCIMMFFTVPLLDPILSLLITCFILFNVYKNLKAAFRIILQGVPENINPDEIREKLLAMKGIKDVHDLRVWTMDGLYNILTLHVVTGNQSLEQSELLKKEVRHELQHLHVSHTTIELEVNGNHCEMNDNQSNRSR
ncbi:MAG: cation transporter [Azospira oryzae]|nr:MAG: cation transporter [Azospira oryzae]